MQQEATKMPAEKMAELIDRIAKGWEKDPEKAAKKLLVEAKAGGKN